MGRTPASLGRVAFTKRHHSRMPFGIVLGITWIVGIFGLERDRVSSFQVPIVLVGGLLAYGLVVVIRRSVANRHERVVATPLEQPPPCVTIRWYGEERSRRAHPSGEARTAPTAHVRLVTIEGGRPADSPKTKTARRLDYIPLHGA